MFLECDKYVVVVAYPHVDNVCVFVKLKKIELYFRNVCNAG